MNKNTLVFVLFSAFCISGLMYAVKVFNDTAFDSTTTVSHREDSLPEVSDTSRTETVPVTVSDTTSSTDTLPPRDTSKDEAYYNRTHIPFATNFSETKYSNIELWTDRDKKILPILRYSSSTKTYEPFISDLTKVSGFWQAYGKSELGLMFFDIVGWSDDGRYLVFMHIPYEGFDSSKLFYLDTQDLEKGIVAVPDFLSESQALSAYIHNKILGYTTESNSNTEKVIVFDINTLQVKDLYVNNDQDNTIFEPVFYGSADGFTGRWIDSKTVMFKLGNRDLADTYGGTAGEDQKNAFTKSQRTIKISVP